MSVFLPGRSYLALNGPLSLADIASILPVDRLEVDAAELGIQELRVVLGTAYQRPYGEQRLLVITNAEQLTEACQTTLLKVLEEPPNALAIVLVATTAEKLLPTVRSRLHIHQQAPEVREKFVSTFPSTEPEADKLLRAIKDRLALVAVLKNELQFQLHQSVTNLQPERLSILERALIRLERNSNQKLVIDWLLLHWFS